jgi:hypothetical protein
MTRSLFNEAVLAESEAINARIRAELLASDEEDAIIASAIAGAGKSTLVTEAACEAVAAGARVAVTAWTNEQVFSLTRSLADRNPSQRIDYCPAHGVTLPLWARRSNIVVHDRAHAASGEQIIVATLDKFASALNPSKGAALAGTDILIIDEAYQADSGKYLGVASIASRHLLVGDGGQIPPFSTAKAVYEYRGLPEDPLKTAPNVLLTNHPHTAVHRLPITRRLDSRAAAMARHFYPPGHRFNAAVADGVRQVTLLPGISGDMRGRAIDAGLDHAATAGWAYMELPNRHTRPADMQAARLIADMLARLMHRAPTLVCERNRTPRPLMIDRIAVAVSHNEQKGILKQLLASIGLGTVEVNTANKLQGLEFDVVFAWHPLSGNLDVDEFHLEAGRLCVMATRHRHACIVVGRAGDRHLVEGPAPATPAYPGDALEGNDTLRGWEVHQNVFRELRQHAFDVPT